MRRRTNRSRDELTRDEQEEAHMRLLFAVAQSGLSARAMAKDVLLRNERTVRRWIAQDSPILAEVLEWLRHHAPEPCELCLRNNDDLAAVGRAVVTADIDHGLDGDHLIGDTPVCADCLRELVEPDTPCEPITIELRYPWA